MKLLKEIINDVEITSLHGNKSLLVKQVCFDSRQVRSGSLFVATKGVNVDGHKFINDSIKAGAVAVLCEELPVEINKDITYIVVNNSSIALGQIASNFYDNPSSKLTLVGITGTNGKTTVATLLFNLFMSLNYKAGLLSTINNQIIDEIISSTHTTADALQINYLLHRMVVKKCTHCFMEVSSHAIEQHRIAGLNFKGGVFTNISHDHLDYHKTFPDYINAKKKFFDSLNKDAFALVNKDDKRAEVMLQNSKATKYTFSLHGMSDFKAMIIENHFSGMLLNIAGENVWFKIFGKFNAYNLLAVFGAARLLDQDKTKILTIISNLKSVEGRMDFVKLSNNINGIVDYAHTPDAIKNVLSTIKEICIGRESIITVMGCGGDRDKAKRPIMAKIACGFSDKLILTADNPRSEDPDMIIQEMKKGVEPENEKKVLSIVNRKEAIRAAVALSKENDVILIAGKGHEKYQEIKGIKYPFNDKEILLESYGILKTKETT